MKPIEFIISFLIIIFALFILWHALFPFDSPSWMGFVDVNDNQNIKTLWDWLDLLIVPVSIGVVGWIYKEYEKSKEERRIKEDKYNDILDSYFKNISDLILNSNLTKNKKNKKSKKIARTRTIIALEELDGERKGQILQFLRETKLLKKIDILGANFSEGDFEGLVLRNQIIKGVNFKNSNFDNSYLDGTQFISCDLDSCSFSNSSLKNVDFNYSKLNNSTIRNTDVTTVKFEGAELNNVDLRSTNILPSQFKEIVKFSKNIKIDKYE